MTGLGFSGERAFVTGGTRGIGRAIAEALADEGAHVVVTGKQPRPDWMSERSGIEHLQLDLEHPELPASLEAYLDGAAPFSVCVNNAGINLVADVRDVDPSDLRRILEINLVAPAIVTRSLGRRMADAGGGHIVNVASIYGLASRAGRSSYSASKSGLIGQTRAVALDLAPRGVLVNCVAPGFVDTDLTRRVLGEDGMREVAAGVPLRRLASPLEIARAVCFLASRLNTYITGQVLVVDGGFLAR